MMRLSRVIANVAMLAAAMLAAAGTVMPPAAANEPGRLVSLDQRIDPATLKRYHHTDQGTRLLPAAWLAALRKADDTAFMNPADLARLGFLVDGVATDARNPYGWPVGFAVSDPATTGGVPIAGFTCALCHTGQIEHKGTAIRIEGGQSTIDLPRFVQALFAALADTARKPDRLRRFIADASGVGYPAERVERDVGAALASLEKASGTPAGPPITQLPPGRGRLDAVQGIANQVFATDLGVPANAKNLDAPVSYPFLWDIWRLSWLQYNGFLPPQSTSRNIGEVLGTRARTHFVDPATGAPNPEPLRWQTSVRLDNINWMEKTLEALRAPTWPADVLGPIDAAKAAAGRALFAENCAGCHGIKVLPNGLWDAPVVSLSRIGTDPNQATNWAARTYDASKLGLGTAVPASELVVAVNAIRRQLYADHATPESERERNVVFEAPCGYKARPLIGVWATPPFLHNGSVRTIFDLLSDARPTTFRTGSREYDPLHLGYTEGDSPDPLLLDTSLPGNRNTGHWWTDDAARPGRIGRKLAEDEKYALIEYLKAASYDDYPSRPVAAMEPLPCGNDRSWAAGGSLPGTR